MPYLIYFCQRGYLSVLTFKSDNFGKVILWRFNCSEIRCSDPLSFIILYFKLSRNRFKQLSPIKNESKFQTGSVYCLTTHD